MCVCAAIYRYSYGEKSNYCVGKLCTHMHVHVYCMHYYCISIDTYRLNHNPHRMQNVCVCSHIQLLRRLVCAVCVCSHTQLL